MNHQNPKSIVEPFISIIERLGRHWLLEGRTQPPVVSEFEIRDRKIAKRRDYFDPVTIQNGFATASAGAS